jgi:hypothetical protein
MTVIQPEYMNLQSLLTNKIYTIPEYQRAYSWTREQRTALFEDIEKIHQRSLQNPESFHFMSTLVCFRPKDCITHILGNAVEKLEIVDGQQRMTTLIILLKSLTNKWKLVLDEGTALPEDNSKDTLENVSKRLVFDNGAQVVMQTNHASTLQVLNRFLKDELPQNIIAETIADKTLLDAIYESKVFIDGWAEKQRSLMSLLILLQSKLRFVLFQTARMEEVYTIFEVLNSRGLPVTSLDTFKSILMGKACEFNADESIIKNIHKSWQGIYNVIGNGKIQSIPQRTIYSEILRFTAKLKGFGGTRSLPKETKSSNALIEMMFQDNHENQNYAAEIAQIEQLAQYVLDVASSYVKFCSDRRTRAVMMISQIRLTAIAIDLSELRKPEKDNLLLKLEKTAFKMYAMIGLPQKKEAKEFYALAHSISCNQILYDEIFDTLENISNKYPINYAIQMFQQRGDCYSTNQDKEYLHYFMRRREEFLQGNSAESPDWSIIWQKQLGNTIEHILPQSSGESFVHRLGNLVLVKANATHSDKDALAKLESYTSHEHIRIVIEKSNGQWTLAEIEAREDALLNWARLEWGNDAPASTKFTKVA